MTLEEYFPGSQARRHAWVSRIKTVCWVCGHDWGKWTIDQRTYQTHHIQRRSSCYPNWHDVECNLLACCALCHETRLASMPHAEQLAMKLLNDPLAYNLEMWLHCRDGPVLRSAERVTGEDVLAFE